MGRGGYTKRENPLETELDHDPNAKRAAIWDHEHGCWKLLVEYASTDPDCQLREAHEWQAANDADPTAREYSRHWLEARGWRGEWEQVR